jgi:tetratricopeptide (TPR) repeat protein
MIERFPVNCQTARLPATIAKAPAAAFNQLANASGVLYALGRRSDAVTASTMALNLFPNSGFLHYIRGKSYAESRMFPQAEADYLAAAALEPNDAIYSELAQLYADEGRVEPALSALQKAAAYSKQAYLSDVTLGEAYVQAQRPRQALEWFDLAERSAPKNLSESQQNQAFLFRLAQGRADAWAMLGEPQRAVQYQETATRLHPTDASAWRALCDLYAKTGRSEDAARAKRQSEIEAGNPAQP